MDAILAVAGLGSSPPATGKADPERGRQASEIPVKIEDLINKGDMTQNLSLRPGDVIVVPESRF